MLIHCLLIAYHNTLAEYLFILHLVKTVSAAELIIRAVINFRAGGRVCRKKFQKKKFEKLSQFRKLSHSAEKRRTVPRKSHSISLYLETNNSLLITGCVS